MKTIKININDLKEYTRNTKIHTDKQIKHIANSIKEFGFTQPILIDENNIIIAGHGRYRASKKLKLQTVPVIIIDYLTEDQKKAYRIVDNSIALDTEMDLDKLSEEILKIKTIKWEDFGLKDLDITELETVRKPGEFKKKQVICPHCGNIMEV